MEFLVTTSNTELKRMPSPTGDGEVAQIGDTQVPLLDYLFNYRLVQPTTTQEGASDHVGKLYCDELGEGYAEVICIPIMELPRQRRLFDSSGTTEELLCYSVDGEFPSEKVENPVSAKCGEYELKDGVRVFKALCPKAYWDGGKPECSEVITVLFFDLTNKVPFRIQFKRTSMSAWNRFIKGEYKKFKNIAKIKGGSILDYAVKIKAAKEKAYYNFKFEFVPNEEAKAYTPLLEFYREMATKSPVTDSEDTVVTGNDKVGIDVEDGDVEEVKTFEV